MTFTRKCYTWFEIMCKNSNPKLILCSELKNLVDVFGSRPKKLMKLMYIKLINIKLINIKLFSICSSYTVLLRADVVYISSIILSIL